MENRIEVRHINTSDIKEIGKDTLYYIPAKIIPALISFISIAMYTRLLTPNEYGLYILVITTVSIVNAFGFNWIGYVVWRYFEKYKNNNNLSQFISTALTVIVIAFAVIALLWYTVTLLLNRYIGSHFAYLLRIGIAVLGAQIGLSFVLEILRLSRQSKKYSLYSCVTALGTLLLAIVFLYTFSHGAEGILLAIIPISGGIFLFEMRRMYKYWKIKCPYISSTILKRILLFGMPQIGIAGGSILLSIADRYMIRAFIGTEAVGIYAAGYTIADLGIQLPLSILTLAAVPIVVSTFENKGITETSKLLRNLIGIYFVILFPVAFGIAALSKWIISIVIGELFQETSMILPWVIAGVFFFGLSQYINIPFQLKEKPRILVYLIFSSAILNIILNLFMIPRFGILGAAYTTLIAYFIYCIISYMVTLKIFPLSLPWVVLGKSLVGSFVMYLTLSLIGGTFSSNIGIFVIKIIIGVCIYCLILISLKEQIFWGGMKFILQSIERKRVGVMNR